MRKTFKRYGGLLFIGVALVVRMLFSLFPQLFEALYFRTLFPFIRKIQYPIGMVLPFSGYYFLIVVAIAWLIWRLPKSRAKKKWLTFGRRLTNFCGGIIALFLLLWGYNYVGPSLADRLSLAKTDNQYDVAKLYLFTMNEAAEQRKTIVLPHDSAAVEDLAIEIDYIALNDAVKEVLQPLGYPISTGVKLRRVMPEGALRRVGIRGIYNPFTGEANVESDAGVLTGAFTAAHEMAHAYGITGEGEANLVAYMALINSGDAVWEYSARYALWRYVASEVNQKLDEADRAVLAEAIPEGLWRDRMAIWMRFSNRPPYFPELSETVNDSYLKIQGVESGTEDYNAFIGLYIRYANPLMAE